MYNSAAIDKLPRRRRPVHLLGVLHLLPAGYPCPLGLSIKPDAGVEQGRPLGYEAKLCLPLPLAWRTIRWDMQRGENRAIWQFVRVNFTLGVKYTSVWGLAFALTFGLDQR